MERFPQINLTDFYAKNKTVHFSDSQNSNFRYQLLYLGDKYNQKTKQHFPIPQLNSFPKTRSQRASKTKCLMNGLFN